MCRTHIVSIYDTRILLRFNWLGWGGKKAPVCISGDAFQRGKPAQGLSKENEGPAGRICLLCFNLLWPCPTYMVWTAWYLEFKKGVEGKKPPFASSETLFSPGQSSLAELQVSVPFLSKIHPLFPRMLSAWSNSKNLEKRLSCSS